MSIIERRIIWNKAKVVPGRDKRLYRYDKTGRMIHWHKYGKRTPMGWEVDHIVSLADCGSERICNKQALQWRENRKKGADSWDNDCEPSFIEGLIQVGTLSLAIIGTIQIAGALVQTWQAHQNQQRLRTNYNS